MIRKLKLIWCFPSKRIKARCLHGAVHQLPYYDTPCISSLKLRIKKKVRRSIPLFIIKP